MAIRNIIAFIAILVLLIKQSDAQEKLNEGKLTFDFRYPDKAGINAELLSVRVIKGKTVYFKNGKTRVESVDANDEAVILDPKNKEKIVLYQNKLAIKMTFDEAQQNEALLFGEPVVKVTSETRVIAGYNCHKINATYEVWNKPNRTMELWVTNDLAATNEKFNFKGIDGYILSYSYMDILYPGEEAVDFEEIMVCSKVEKTKISDDLFKVPPDYQITTMEEMRKNMQIEHK